MRLSKPRLTPLTEDEIDPELLPRLGLGRTKNVFKTLARHPALTRRSLPYGNHILYKNSMSGRERELAILRVGWLCRAEYEWGQHAEIGRDEGLTDEEILRITQGSDAPGWSDLERAILSATDELHHDAFVSDETWATLEAHYSTEQVMDLVFTVGHYHTISMALNSFGVQLEPGVEGFPKDAG
jgi:4-carboxymuconolactone decarboxylase